MNFGAYLNAFNPHTIQVNLTENNVVNYNSQHNEAMEHVIGHCHNCISNFIVPTNDYIFNLLISKIESINADHYIALNFIDKLKKPPRS